MYSNIILVLIFCISTIVNPSSIYRQKGHFIINATNIMESTESNQYNSIFRSLYSDALIAVKINCGETSEFSFYFDWLIYEQKCFNTNETTDVVIYKSKNQGVLTCTKNHQIHIQNEIDDMIKEFARATTTTTTTTITKKPKINRKKREIIEHNKTTRKANVTLIMSTPTSTIAKVTKKEEVTKSNDKELIVDERSNPLVHMHHTDNVEDYKIAKVKEDGLYIFRMIIRKTPKTIASPLDTTIIVWIKNPTGFLPAIGWPLLPFYGCMSAMYIMMGIMWLIMCACNWKDIQRIQILIGVVIFLGMLEKAIFFGAYKTVNDTGDTDPKIFVLAELVSCAKKALARMLVVVVSLGFGISKPRLGPMLNKVVTMGLAFFLLAGLEGYMRAVEENSTNHSKIFIYGIPLAILDACICWWIFSSLVIIQRQLRIRKNIVKLRLYQHFTNLLIFCVLASLIFMCWSYKQKNMRICISEWEQLWIEDAYWHVLFSVILMSIMVLWRPSFVSQRYASYMPTDIEDLDQEPLISDAYDGLSNRQLHDTKASKRTDPQTKAEEDLKWIEENIPQTVADSIIPEIIESDEEIMTTRFEMSKME